MNILIADDHPVVALGVQALLQDLPGVKIVACVQNSTELIGALENRPVDVVITDYAMPGGAYGDGIEMLARIRRRYPSVKLIVLTVLSNAAVLSKVARSGVDGLLNKGSELNEIPLALERVCRGLTYFGKTVSNALAEQMLRPEIDKIRTLSPRELEVIRLFLTGTSVQNIALALRRSPKTVSNQKRAAMSKLGCNTDVELFNYHSLIGVSVDLAAHDEP
jgi:two-component system capsular synthesis response regulator RcsB